jgi:hypothetical protein
MAAEIDSHNPAHVHACGEFMRFVGLWRAAGMVPPRDVWPRLRKLIADDTASPETVARTLAAGRLALAHLLADRIAAGDPSAVKLWLFCVRCGLTTH